MTEIRMRQATEDDIQTVVDLWNEAAAWIREKGSDQWQYPVRMDNIRRAIEKRTCWLAEDGQGEAIATVTLDEEADSQLWRPEDRPSSALYLHRLVVRETHRGQGLGSEILDWAGQRVEHSGKEFLRLDAWTSNKGLHQYYLNEGFKCVRTVLQAGVFSGKLFERSTSAQNLERASRIGGGP